MTFKYKGGGYWRDDSIPKGEKADIIHGEEAIELGRWTLVADMNQMTSALLRIRELEERFRRGELSRSERYYLVQAELRIALGDDEPPSYISVGSCCKAS